jgi:hypothetical protein
MLSTGDWKCIHLFITFAQVRALQLEERPLVLVLDHYWSVSVYHYAFASTQNSAGGLTSYQKVSEVLVRVILQQQKCRVCGN